MSTKLHRTFPTRERFVQEFVRRLSERGIELNLPGEQAPPTGTVLHLDLRLEDGTALIVGTGEVTEGGHPGDAFRVRFLDLTRESRTHLGELVIKAASVPVERRPAPGAGSRSLIDLVTDTYGDDTPAGPTDSSAVMVPPDAGSAPAPAGPRTSRPAPTKAPASKPRSSGWRAQVSPGVIVIAVIAGAAGAAAQAWFDDLAELVWHMTDESSPGASLSVTDLMPANVSPSDFSTEEAAGDGANDLETAGDASPDEQTADGEVPQPVAAQNATELATDSGDGAPTVVDSSGALLEGLSPADRIRLITWEEGVESTVVTLWGNGAFLTERIAHTRVEAGQRRIVFRIRGIDLPYRETVLTVATPEVQRIRTGFHPRDQVNELHLVFDLATDDVRLERIERGASSLSLHLASGVDESPDVASTTG